MLTPEQIEGLQGAFGRIADPINDFLLEDIARRIAGAGQLTSTASYQVWRAQQLGLSQREIKRRLQKLLDAGGEEIERLLTQSAETGYRFDLAHLPTTKAVPFAENAVIQQMVSAAVKLAREDFTNLTQTLGMVDPGGRVQPLQAAYRKCMDYAFEQVFTGAADYNTAVRRATKHLADRGVRVIDYESGVHTSLEAAVRRNVMGGLGLLQERITRRNHDELGADGWEISAHAASAPDHEPIQGRQYGDEAYQALNNSLKRRIGTLNCGHGAFPIILGVSSPQYTAEQLRRLRGDNERGVTYQGRHYTLYEATQKQRQVERAIRRQKQRILVDEAVGDGEKLTTDRIRLGRLREEYGRFSKAAGLRPQNERTWVADLGGGRAAETVENKAQPAILDDEDMYAINQYKSARSYQINAALRGEMPMTEQLQAIVDSIDRALEKLPIYEGTVYRSITDFGIDDMDAFWNQHAVGKKIRFPAYISSGTQIYDDGFPIQYVILSKKGRDMREYNPTEFEVLFQRNSEFKVVQVDGRTIYMEEV